MRVPKKDFLLFKKECLRLQKAWGLSGWELSFVFKPLNNSFGNTNANLESRKVTLTFSATLSDDTESDRNPRRTAKHEMLHVLLWRLSCNGRARYPTESEMDETEHELVMQLMKIIP